MEGFGYRFYNAGKRINEVLRFSISESSGGKGGYSANDMQGVGYWAIDAPEKSWVFVPAEIQSGTETVRVNFKQDVITKFGQHGVVLLDERHKAENEDPEKPLQPIAATEEAVIARAEEIWKLYTLTVIERHLSDCDQALAAGGRPRKAVGFTKFCFKLHGKIDPGDTYAHTENVPRQDAGIQAQLSMLTGLFMALASGQKIDPDTLKGLMTPTGATEGTVVTSGIATGKITKPIDTTRADGWDKSTVTGKGKSERSKEAVSAL